MPEKKKASHGVWMNVDHPKFDIAMELLCTLPVLPRHALCKNVVSDLALGNHSELQSIRSQVAKRFDIAIEVTNSRTSGRVIGVRSRDGKRQRDLSEAYWAAVYP